ncbi:hypothetical protein [Dictyobacter formicarum]|uniref:Uncharacterized protein n=1 Tax=Dictyobacter formicarum TaxID=2778368 RepID=A0ABQ3VHI5_9CHLR|nr:hypothetical protein [Dictyobacter formicarum]GHO85245.1 hypothetical protein KSZ_32510 [Dictyobacter formicarum]
MNDLAKLSELRRQYTDLEISPDAIQAFTDHYLVLQIARRLTDIADHRDGICNMLEIARKFIAQKLQEPHPKRYELCLHVLLYQLMTSLLIKAQERRVSTGQAGGIYLFV